MGVQGIEITIYGVMNMQSLIKKKRTTGDLLPCIWGFLFEYVHFIDQYQNNETDFLDNFPCIADIFSSYCM